MTAAVAKSIFAFAVIIWGFLRYPYQRRASRVPVWKSARGTRERLLLGAATFGLGLIPIFYVATGFPGFAERRFLPGMAYAGTLLFVVALWLFHRAHRDLGRNFSVSLDIRDDHRLVTNGVYARIRHPMYLAFWLWAVAQAALLPNWFAGLAGIVGFGLLYFGRIEQEERLMLETFGDEYRTYMSRTARIVPWIS
jgi:protein-S-isoprenylcysteine O-methyltransferase Ste14